MNFIIFSILSVLLLGGCTNRPQVVQVATEPDTEWILAQYANQNEREVNERRIREGW